MDLIFVGTASCTPITTRGVSRKLYDSIGNEDLLFGIPIQTRCNALMDFKEEREYLTSVKEHSFKIKEVLPSGHARSPKYS
mmetsp:Transcript_398/g.547  ORF Transcript_398/g.547 Transcript_398/m.547 type:complete len:81 (+) Transcript_398:230-472(+)